LIALKRFGRPEHGERHGGALIMATILCISSQVVRGTVGNSVAGFALQRLGHVVWQLPTVLLSNHPGHGAFAGRPQSAEALRELWRGLKAHSWQREIDAVLTGYIPSASGVAVVSEIVEELKSISPDVMVVCDPAIGDEPKGLYVPEAAAETLKESLLTLADITTPNRFELSWLTGQSLATSPSDARDALDGLGIATAIATSIPEPANKPGGDLISNVLSDAGHALSCASHRLAAAPNGTGDLFGALFLGFRLNGLSSEVALGQATAGLQTILEASQGHDELRIVDSQDQWSKLPALPCRAVET